VERKDKHLAAIAGGLKSAKTPNLDLIKQERPAIQEQQKEKSMITLPAEKSKTTADMETKKFQ